MPARHLACLATATLLLALTPATSAVARTWQPANDRVLQQVREIESRLQTSAYKPVLRINERRGHYEFDCSAMAGWLLQRAAPRARAAIDKPRPLARDFVAVIERAAPDRPKQGWLRVPRIADAQPGDVLVWRRPRWFPSKNTGHIAFVVEAPRPLLGGMLVRIADATSIGHGNDSRGVGQTGFGIGTLWVTVDPATGAGTGYGWQGEASARAGYVIETPVLIGRAWR